MTIIPQIVQPPHQRPLVAIENILLPNPAVASNIRVDTPVDTHLQLIALRLILTCDANVADRFLHFHIYTPSGRVYDIASSTPSTANLAWTYCFAQSVPPIPAAGLIFQFVLPLPTGLTLLTGSRFETEIVNAQAGDQITEANYQVVIHRFKET